MITWVEQSAEFHRWLTRRSVRVERAVPGVEAETLLLAVGGEPEYVLKLWRRGFRGDARQQHGFLVQAERLGLPVPKPAGWGVDGEGRQVLATRFAGHAVDSFNDDHVRRCARLLSRIHAVPAADFRSLPLVRSDDPLGLAWRRYLSNLAPYPGMPQVIEHLQTIIEPAAPALVHGDYNLGNVLVDGNHLTAIDWTNVGIGDARCDAAWATTLLWIYTTQERSALFEQEYAAAAGRLDEDQWAAREALAAVQWILFDCAFGVAKGAEQARRAYAFAAARLPQSLAHALPRR